MINVDFLRMSSSSREQSMNNDSSKKTMMLGAVVCAAGVLATIATYSGTASTAELPYVFAWGAIIFGGIQVVRGVVGIGPSNQR